METIFEHNVTEEEMISLFSFVPKKEMMLNLTENQNIVGIYKLYMIRKDRVNAEKYASMLPDTIEKIFGVCNHDFAN